MGRQSELLREVAGNEQALQRLKSALMADVGDRVRQARGKDTSRAALAKWMCVHENTIGKIERGETMPDALQVLQLAALLKRPVGWLLGEEAEAESWAGVPNSVEVVDQGDYSFVPQFMLGMVGSEIFDDVKHVEGMRPFSRHFLREELQIKSNTAMLVPVTGPGMEPQVRPGDVVLVDRTEPAAYVEGAHLIRMGLTFVIRNLQRMPGGRLRVSGLNSTYEPFEVPIYSEATDDFEVIGRVRWAGVTFR